MFRLPLLQMEKRKAPKTKRNDLLIKTYSIYRGEPIVETLEYAINLKITIVIRHILIHNYQIGNLV